MKINGGPDKTTLDIDAEAKAGSSLMIPLTNSREFTSEQDSENRPGDMPKSHKNPCENPRSNSYKILSGKIIPVKVLKKRNSGPRLINTNNPPTDAQNQGNEYNGKDTSHERPWVNR